MSKSRTSLRGVLTVVGHRAFDVAVLSAHYGWRAAVVVGQTLDPHRLAERFEALRRTLAAEAEIASRR